MMKAKKVKAAINPKHSLKSSKLFQKKKLVEKVARNSARQLESEEQARKQSLTDDEPEYLKPAINWFLHVGKKVLQIRIDLPKVPQKCINLEVKEKSLYIDTLKFTRKYKYEGPLYGGVTVDPSGVEAELGKDLLMVRVPVMEIPEETEKRELQIVEAKKVAKTIKFPQEVKKSIVAAAERRDKKSEKRLKKKLEKRFHEQHLDIAQVKTKKKTKKQSK